MKYVLIAATCLLTASMAMAETATKPESLIDRFSYAVGMDVANGMKLQEIDINKDLFIQGFSDGHDGSETLMTETEARESLMAMQMQLQQKMQGAREGQASKNQEEAEAFLDANKDKEGVVALDSGLQYQVLSEGEGAMPSASDSVTVHYTGTLLDGTVFDSSVERGEPATFPLTGVIPGWTEGLQLMKTGAKYKFFIPPELAYGERGAGGRIGPNAALIFDVELISIN